MLFFIEGLSAACMLFEQSSKSYHNSALCILHFALPLPFALCPLHLFLIFRCAEIIRDIFAEFKDLVYKLEGDSRVVKLGVEFL